MSNEILSQEEIDALLNGNDTKPSDTAPEDLENEDKDILGEIGNICMGSAATTLSTLIGQPVNITTPRVKLITLKELKNDFKAPMISIEVKFCKGLEGANVMVLNISDAGVIADLMMGGKGECKKEELSEIEISAVSEAMNQMIGTAATSMASMFKREMNISPPNAFLWNSNAQKLSDLIDENENIVQVSFKLIIGEFVNSEIMQILPLNTAKDIIDAMMSGFKDTTPKTEEPKKAENREEIREVKEAEQIEETQKTNEVPVQKVRFMPLEKTEEDNKIRNIDLIMDVPIDISVILGKTQKTIKEVLDMGSGSLIELDRLVEEPVDILVNGKKVAQGEVVVVNENFGVRITNILSNVERVKELEKNKGM